MKKMVIGIVAAMMVFGTSDINAKGRNHNSRHNIIKKEVRAEMARRDRIMMERERMREMDRRNYVVVPARRPHPAPVKVVHVHHDNNASAVIAGAVAGVVTSVIMNAAK